MASVLVYAVLAAILGRDVLANLSTTVANDDGDPLLTAAILRWNTLHVPWTDAWWQFPNFDPTRDTLAFSEHLLGLSAIAAPLQWLTGNPLLTYNIVALLTFVLSGAAMYLLVHRLTRSAPAAFLAGLAFGFAPYRISQLPHIQMLAAFWAPLALLGLHAFVESGRKRWLVLYGAAWALQAAANGYALVFFSVLVGLWVLWFVVARGRWRDLGWIALANVVAAMPLAPILWTYIAVHDRHGLTRGVEEVRNYSADVSAILCAPADLTFWGWLRVGCGPEGELFPGVALAIMAVVALLGVVGVISPVPAAASPRLVIVVRRLLFAVAAVYGAIVMSILIAGPWQADLGIVDISARSLKGPLFITLAALVAALVLSPRVRASARRASTAGFYLFAALVTWLLALGPAIAFRGEPTGVAGPFAGLMLVPGMDGLRVPARFWLMSALCLAVAAGIGAADLLARRSRIAVSIALVVLGAALAADGWVDRITAAPAPPHVPAASQLTGRVVLELPVDDLHDIAAQWRAVIGGWRTVNGFSGFAPAYYKALERASQFEDDALFVPFRRDGDLHVIVPRDTSRLIALVERQPDVIRTAADAWALQYRLPRRASPAAAAGEALPIAALQTRCDSPRVGLALDRDETTRWVCPPNTASRPELRIDLADRAVVGAFVLGMGAFSWEAPRSIVVETSIDGEAWAAGWNGSILTNIVDAARRDPKSLRVIVPVPPREARYVRVRAEDQGPDFHFTVAEVSVHGPAS